MEPPSSAVSKSKKMALPNEFEARMMVRPSRGCEIRANSAGSIVGTIGVCYSVGSSWITQVDRALGGGELSGGGAVGGGMGPGASRQASSWEYRNWTDPCMECGRGIGSDRCKWTDLFRERNHRTLGRERIRWGARFWQILSWCSASGQGSWERGGVQQVDCSASRQGSWGGGSGELDAESAEGWAGGEYWTGLLGWGGF